MKQFIQKLSFNDLLVFLTSLAFVISPLIVDFDSLPKGWELPKVYFWAIFSLILVFCIYVVRLYKFFSNKDAKVNYNYIFLIILTIVLFLSTFFSEYGRTIFPESTSNPIYKLIANIYSPNSPFVGSMSLYGNSFRDQGLITFLILILFFWEIGKSVNKRNWHLISSAFILSSLISGVKALIQFREYAISDPDRLKEGMWVFGWFGQSNFYAGYILIGVIFAAYYLRSKFLPIKILAIPLTIFLAFCLSLSYSMWGIVSLIVATVLVIVYEVLPKKLYPLFLLSLGVSFLVLYNWFILQIERESGLRVMIWDNAYEIYVETPFENPSPEHAKLFLFGSGFDTLGEMFKSKGRLEGLYVDRGHNFLIDIIVSSGMVGLTFFTGLLIKITQRFKSNLNDRIFGFTLIALVVWMFRSFVHENGIINIVQFFVLLSILINFQSKPSEQKI